MKTAVAFFGRCLLALPVLLSGGWAALVALYCGPHNDVARAALVAAVIMVAVSCAVAIVARRWRRRLVPLHVASLALAGVLFAAMQPSNDRDWQPDVSRLAVAKIDGDRITIRNIRNFTYASEFEYTPSYYDRSFDLGKLSGVDVIATYWMGPAIAHVFVSFAFADGEHLAISIETRKERGESYSTLRGFFRQYELYYVVADERDVIRLRTNYRKSPPEQVYVYRVQAPIENGRRLLLSYLERMNRLAGSPEFYNTLTSNCTTNVWMHSLGNAEHVPLSWKLLASGYVPQFLYEQGRLDTSMAFEDLRQRAFVNLRALEAAPDADFSRRIRAGSDVARAR